MTKYIFLLDQATVHDKLHLQLSRNQEGLGLREIFERLCVHKLDTIFIFFFQISLPIRNDAFNLKTYILIPLACMCDSQVSTLLTIALLTRIKMAKKIKTLKKHKFEYFVKSWLRMAQTFGTNRSPDPLPSLSLCHQNTPKHLAQGSI